MNALEGVGLVVVGGVAVVGIYVVYRVYKAVAGAVGVVEKAGGAVTSAAQSAWNARPKIIFKGTDDLSLLSGLI